MLKKIILGTLLVGFIGVLAAFAIIRTVNKTANVAEARGLGQGHGAAQEVSNETQGAGRSVDADVNGNGGGRYGQAGAVERQYPNHDEAPTEWTTYEGTVVQAPEDGVDLIIETTGGEELVVGTGPGYMEDQGLTLEAGEAVQVRGYWEDGEFKAAELTRLRDGETITLRDQIGIPAWGGRGRNAQAAAGGGYGSENSADALADGTATGPAQVNEWLTLNGTVTSVDTNALVLQTGDGQEIVVENRAWWFAQDQGFSAAAGDSVTVVGFYEGQDFEVGRIDNLTSGQTADIREVGGRPLWAGGGRRAG